MNKLWKTGKDSAILIFILPSALVLSNPDGMNKMIVKKNRKSGTDANNPW